MYIQKSKREQRILHWQQIKSRVTTHEGEMLTGKKGETYQKKYSKKHLGIDLGKPTDFNQLTYQQELQRT